jgi:cytoskeletal protein CcmA (bactofilin family)
MRYLILIAWLVLPLVAYADNDSDDDNVGHSIGSHWVGTGGTVLITSPIEGDAYLTGGDVTISAPIGGRTFVAGGNIAIDAELAHSLYATGGTITIGGGVGGDARVLGSSVDVHPSAHIRGAFSAAARTVTMAGHVDGSFKAAARDIVIDGTIGGDAELASEHIEIGPNAHIGGKLRYRSEHAPQVAPGAEITAGLEQLHGRRSGFDFGLGAAAERAASGVGHGLRFSGGFMLGALLLLVAPAFMRTTSNIAQFEWAGSLGIGIAVVLLVPLACVFLVLTLIGIPLALLVAVLYLAVIMVGQVCAMTAVGDFLLARFAPAHVAAVGWRILGLFGALVVFEVLRRVPLLGVLLSAAIYLIGVGALTQRLIRPGWKDSAGAAGRSPAAG